MHDKEAFMTGDGTIQRRLDNNECPWCRNPLVEIKTCVRRCSVCRGTVIENKEEGFDIFSPPNKEDKTWLE